MTREEKSGGKAVASYQGGAFEYGKSTEGGKGKKKRVLTEKESERSMALSRMLGKGGRGGFRASAGGGNYPITFLITGE